MTCIVGCINRRDGNVIIGGDTAASNGEFIEGRLDTKVFKRGDFIFGCTTSFRMIQILRFNLKIPEIDGKEIYEYMCTDFIESVRKCFEEFGFIERSLSSGDRGGTFLVGYKNKLFKIEGDFQVGVVMDEYTAVGSGYLVALGCLYANHGRDIDSFTKVDMALKASEKYSLGVRGPFIILET